MEVLLLLGAIVGGFWLIGRISEWLNPPSRPPTATPPSERGSSGGGASPGARGDTYRPRPPSSSRPKVVFRDVDGHGAEPDISGLHDAFTGAPLNRQLGLAQCSNCSVYYHAESVEIIRAENAGRCVACGQAAIRISSAKTEQSGRDHQPDVVTLADYSQHMGRVVTFAGRVVSVKRSRRGSDYAVMFEQATWARGFKLVFFRGSVGKVGGEAFVNSLAGKHVTVRGLLIQHERFGPEIIISERSMILSVRP